MKTVRKIKYLAIFLVLNYLSIIALLHLLGLSYTLKNIALALAFELMLCCVNSFLVFFYRLKYQP
jgi:hypothetical protein